MKTTIGTLLLLTLTSTYASDMKEVLSKYEAANTPEVKELNNTKWKCSAYDSRGLIVRKPQTKEQIELYGRRPEEDYRFMAQGREALSNMGASGVYRYQYSMDDILEGFSDRDSSGFDSRETLRIGTDGTLYSKYETYSSYSGWETSVVRSCTLK